MLPFSDLAERWREQAQAFRTYGGAVQADALEACAAELEAAEREYCFERLTLEQAAQEAGVSYDTAQRRVASGEWPNAGEKGRPRVRRCDTLPNLDSLPRPVSDRGDHDLAAKVLRARG